jgi:hypothetical protein
MKQITKVFDGYTFDELDDSAKDKVRQWYSEGLDYEWWDYEWFIEKMNDMGIEIDNDRRNKNKPDITWSGFYSQGDGLSFGAYVNVLKFMQFYKLSKKYWSLYLNIKNENLCPNMGIKNHDRYYNMSVHYDIHISNWDVIPDEKYNKLHHDLDELSEVILDICRDAASDFYRDLENEYEYLLSDEQISESCEVNEWLFESNGEMI